MSANVQELYEHIQSLPLKDRLELLSRILADVKAHIEVREELEEWDKLSDEALAAFEKGSEKGTVPVFPFFRA